MKPAASSFSRQLSQIAALLLSAFILLLFSTNSVQAQEPAPTPLPDPLSIPLPAPTPELATDWRPPLYPIPWALTDNDHFYFNRPLAADTVKWSLSAYRYGDTNFGHDTPHTGVDIVVDEGTQVLAGGPGQVVWVGFGLFLGGTDPNDPYGLAVAIEHDYGFKGEPLYTIYAHLSAAYVARRQHVEAGQLIALSGDTGQSTAPHLHFEVRRGVNHYYNSVNPEIWTTPPQGWGMLVGRLTTTWGTPVEGLQIRVTSTTTGERWFAKTYGTDKIINTDPYYNENLVVNDLPAGSYEVMVPYVGRYYRMPIEIYPGAITYFNFRGFKGLNANPPGVELPENLPIGQPAP